MATVEARALLTTTAWKNFGTTKIRICFQFNYSRCWTTSPLPVESEALPPRPLGHSLSVLPYGTLLTLHPHSSLVFVPQTWSNSANPCQLFHITHEILIVLPDSTFYLDFFLICIGSTYFFTGFQMIHILSDPFLKSIVSSKRWLFLACGQSLVVNSAIAIYR